MRQIKLLTGTMLLVLTSTLSINSVNAQQSPAGNSGGTPSQTNIDAGQTPSQTPTESAPTTAPANTQVTPSQTQTAPANTVTGTIRSINGQIVTVEKADGTTQRMTVSPADIQRLNLQQGTQVTATLNAQSVASNITVAPSNSTPTGAGATSPTGITPTTTGAETTTQTGTTPTTTTDTEATTQTTTDTEATTQSDDDDDTEAQSTPANRPVRALW